MKISDLKIWVAALLIQGLAASTAATAAKTFDTTFDPANFSSNPTAIDNGYWPLPAGYTYVYEAESEDECEYNTIFVSAKAKTVMGLDMVVVEDLEFLDEDCDGGAVLTEETDDWYAQDDFGNVWYFGEWTTAYFDDEGNPVIDHSGSWEAGVGGALPGIVMLDESFMEAGLTYQQEFWEGEAEDVAKILRLNSYVETADFGDFEDCVKIKEWTALEPGHVEHKYYCEGIGLVLIEELKEKTVLVELTDIIPPSP